MVELNIWNGLLPVQDEVWTLKLDDNPYTVIIGGSYDIYDPLTDTMESTMINTIAQVAAAMATAINKLTSVNDFTATVNATGDTLVVVNLDEQVFTTSFEILPVGSAVITVVDPTETSVVLSGLPNEGELWTITLNDGVKTSTHSHMVSDTDTLVDIAEGLADNINEYYGIGTYAAYQFVAFNNGDTIRILTLAGMGYATEFEITPRGAAVIDNISAIGDTIVAGHGDNLVFGDNGQITAAQSNVNNWFGELPITLGLAETITPDIGGNDVITTGMGIDILLGGLGSDQIIANDTESYIRGDDTTYDSDNIVLGDNGYIDWTARDSGRDSIHGQTYLHLGDDNDPNDIDRISTTDPNEGGPDTITTGAGDDFVFGGTSGDIIHAGAGNDLVFGDHGKAEAATTITAITLEGTLVAGDAWTVELTVNGEAKSYTYTVPDDGTNLTLASIARALADAINTDDQAQFIVDNQFVAVTDTATLIIVARSGIAFSTTFTNPTIGAIPVAVDATPVPVSAVDADLLPMSAAKLEDPFIYLAIDTQNSDDGGDDLIYGEDGEDIILGQQGDDRIYGGNDDDDIIGGHNVRGGHDGNDRIDGSHTQSNVEDDTDNDVIVGDNGFILRRGDSLSVRLRVLDGDDLIYDQDDVAQITGDPQLNPTGVSERDVVLYDHSFDPLASTHGDDYIAGGPDDDVIFGQLGDDVIQGDGEVALTEDSNEDVSARRIYIYTARDSFDGTDSFEYAYTAFDPVTEELVTRTAIVTITTPELAGLLPTGDLDDDILLIVADGVGGYYPIYFVADQLLANDPDVVGGIERIDYITDASLGTDAKGTLVTELRMITADIPEKERDGDDYIEGGGDNDTIFGNLGQDDIIGGSSDMFGLNDRLMRPDGTDMLFGGAGTDIARNDLGQAELINGAIITEPNGHSRDSDMILGDNGRIMRLVDKVSGNFLEFAYDQNPERAGDFDARGDLRIRIRVAELLDYTLGGHDYDDENALSDIGSYDEIHGESGDDFIYGMVGNDVLFGEGQDDDLIGGYGHDWISGGTGIDGVLGDDGRIYTSRNDKFAEMLYGIAALDQNELDAEISTPGRIQQNEINTSFKVKKSVNLTPFNLDGDNVDWQDPLYDPEFADDVIYGGLGGDFLHGGAGDDAASGAEALPSYYSSPYNPGNLLRFSEPESGGRAGEFAAYDEFGPLSRILVDDTGAWTTIDDVVAREFILNFTSSDTNSPNETHSVDTGFAAYLTDGDDVLFGDLGNDWLVGGTGRDHLYGGYGSDLLNVDDELDTNGGANDVPETHPSYEDTAYGGSGRDVLIANTGGDRLIDWCGEFNSYIVPFAPFGMGTVSRTLQPQIMEYLYMLSQSDGADMTRAADTGADPARNGEPEGELGLVKQQDADWQDQTGAPDDIQAGNIPGGSRDVLRSATFNNGNKDAFFTDSGIWDVRNGALRVSAESLGGDAASVFNVNEMLPNYYEIQATIATDKPTGGWKSNAYIIFDYYSPTDFKFAGLNASLDKMQMGHRTAEGWIVDVQTNMRIKPNIYYNMLVAVNGTTVSLLVDNTELFSHTFQPRIIDGWVYGLNYGMVGFGSDNSRGIFDNVTVQKLPPEITFEGTEDFSDPLADLDFVPADGIWNVNGDRYEVMDALNNEAAISLIDLGLDHGLDVSCILVLDAILNTQTTGGVIFDYYDLDDFKFAAISAENNQVIIGHFTARRGWSYDAVYDIEINPGQDYQINVSLKGVTVNVSVKAAGEDNWQAMVGYVYNAVVVDGSFGLFSKAGGGSSFDTLTVKTDDPVFLTETQQDSTADSASMIASDTADTQSVDSVLTYDALALIVEEAIYRWSEMLSFDQKTLKLLNEVNYQITDLSGSNLGAVIGNTVMIDIDAAGYGWFIDTTPSDDTEFNKFGNETLRSVSHSPAFESMDLLTVVMHELGHILGYEDLDPEQDPYDIMSYTLDPGVRKSYTGALLPQDDTLRQSKKG